VQLIDHIFRWDTDRTDKKRNLLFDHDIHEFGQMAIGIVVLIDSNT
jgi:hypothetical protein